MALPLPWEPPLWLTGVQTSSWKHPVPVPNCSSWPTSTCSSKRPCWDTWEPGSPKPSRWNWLPSLSGRQQGILLHGSGLPQWNKEDNIKLSLMNVLRVLQKSLKGIQHLYMGTTLSPRCVFWIGNQCSQILIKLTRALTLIFRQPTATENRLTSPKKWQMGRAWVDGTKMRGKGEESWEGR